jgi:hypothetical protein
MRKDELRHLIKIFWLNWITVFFDKNCAPKKETGTIQTNRLGNVMINCRLEQYRLEQYRLEQYRLEQYRLEQYRLEQYRLEQYRLEQYTNSWVKFRCYRSRNMLPKWMKKKNNNKEQSDGH